MQHKFRFSVSSSFEGYTLKEDETYLLHLLVELTKYEFGLNKTIPPLDIAKKMAVQAAEIYSNKRHHWSLNLQTCNFNLFLNKKESNYFRTK